MSEQRKAYLCDGHGCDEHCSVNKTVEEWKAYNCHHTLDEKHALHKVRRDRKWNYIPSTEHPGVMDMIEKED